MKLVKNICSLPFLIIIFYQNITQMNTLRCAHTCKIDPVPFGSLHPIKTPCETVEIDTNTTVCSVFLAINFATGHIDGALNKKPRSGNQSSILHLSSMFELDETMTFINYQCATTNDCDEEFVRETISSSKWFQLNETKVRTDLISLLFETDFIIERLICDNNLVCSWLEQCVAELNQNSSISHDHRINFDNKFPCNDKLESHVKFDQYFHAPNGDQNMIMNVLCNKDKCNQQSTIEQVYNIIHKDFILPLNYSAYLSTSNASRRMNDFISIAGVFIFLAFFGLNFSML